MRDEPHKSGARCSHTQLSGLACQDILYSHSDLSLGFKNTTNWQPARPSSFISYISFVTHLKRFVQGIKVKAVDEKHVQFKKEDSTLKRSYITRVSLRSSGRKPNGILTNGSNKSKQDDPPNGWRDPKDCNQGKYSRGP